MARAAHRAEQDDLLRRIYGFADWCRGHRAEDPRTAVGAAFYEHLFDDWSIREDVASWLSTAVVQDAWPLWESRLPPKKIAELRGLLEARSSGARISSRNRP